MAVKEKTADQFKNEFELSNQQHKNLVRDLYVSKAKSILMSVPFGYSERISKEVAEGIVDHADKLMANADVEEDEDSEMNELNNMGDIFQLYKGAKYLLLEVDKKDHAKEKDQVRKTLNFPSVEGLKDYENPIKEKKVNKLPECLNALRSFIQDEAIRRFSATVVFHGKYTKQGDLKFGAGNEVPMEVIAGNVKQFMYRSEEICPRKVYLVVVNADERVQVVCITKGNTMDTYKTDNFMVDAPMEAQ